MGFGSPASWVEHVLRRKQPEPVKEPRYQSNRVPPNKGSQQLQPEMYEVNMDLDSASRLGKECKGKLKISKDLAIQNALRTVPWVTTKKILRGGTMLHKVLIIFRALQNLSDEEMKAERSKVKTSEHRIFSQIRKKKKPESFLFPIWHKCQAMMLTVIVISHCGAEIIVC